MNENVNVCITPKGDKPVLHFSQFDNERVFTVTVLADDGESAVDLTDLDIEFRLRKTDSHVVTIAPISVVSNVITFLTTEQLCACCGQNIASVVIMNNDSVISTLDILVEIQRDILSGGLTSESDIRNLTTQIEQIVPEVIGDDYYNKQEVDDLIAEHTFDPTNYYDKTAVDNLLADKADADDVYTKTETDNLLADKADASDVYTKAEADNLLAYKADIDTVYTILETDELLSYKANAADVYTKTEIDNRFNYTYPLKADYIPFIEGIINGTFGFLDLGSINWTKNGVNRFTGNSVPTGIKAPASQGEAADVATGRFTTTTFTIVYSESTDNTLAVNTNGAVNIVDKDFSDPADFKTSVSGCYMVYELTSAITPTVTQAELDAIIKSFNGNMVNVMLKV